MKKILISPFVEINKYKKIVLSLNLEWFTYLKKLRFKASVFNPYLSSLSQLKNIDVIIISGGGDIYKLKKNKINLLRDKFEKKLIEEGIKMRVPIIAVCRGFQLIVSLFTNKAKNFIKTKEHKNTNHLIVFENKNSISNKNEIVVNSYHNIAIKKLSEKFDIIAKSKDDNIEIAQLKDKKILGLMFHPERKNKDQPAIDKIIKKFISINN